MTVADVWAGLGTAAMFALFLGAIAALFRYQDWRDRRRDQASPFAGWEMPPEIAHEKRVQAPEFLPAPTQTPPAGRRNAGRIPPASRWPSGAGSRPGAQRDPAAAAQAAAAGRTHDTPEPPRRVWLHPCDCPRCRDNPDGPAMIQADEPDGVHDTLTMAAVDARAEQIAAIRALPFDEYAAGLARYEHSDATDSFLAVTTGSS